MNLLFLPLVNWGLGTIIIGVFALVCIILVVVIYNLSRGTNKAKDYIDNTNIENSETKNLSL